MENFILSKRRRGNLPRRFLIFKNQKESVLLRKNKGDRRRKEKAVLSLNELKTDVIEQKTRRFSRKKLMGRGLAIKMILKIIKIKMREKQNKSLPLSADVIE